MNPTRVIVLLVALAPWSAAHAVRVEGMGPSATQHESVASQPAASSQADDSSSLREGVITAIGAGKVQIQGTWLNVVPGKTQVFRQRALVNASTLQKGQKVKFTLAPNTPDRSTLGVVYVP